MKENYKPAKYFFEKFGIHSSTLRNWHVNKEIKAIRTSSKGKRYYLESDIYKKIKYKNKFINHNNHNKKTIIYARVSSAKQQGDLQRQIKCLSEAYPDTEVIKDVASGINFKRPGLRTLLQRVNKGLVSKVIVMHKDRLARLGFDLLDFLFKEAGVKILVHSQSSSNSDPKSNDDEFESDLIAVITLFVASHHGKRSARNRKRRKQQQQNIQNSS